MTIQFKSELELIPAIIQDANTLQVLMLGYMNQESLEVTLKSRKVTFYSRSKQRLWKKGESSGNELDLVEIQYDCDQDAILIFAVPKGVTCHLGRQSCFESDLKLGFLARLEEIISQKLKENDPTSYTLQLVQSGLQRIAQKVGEEGVEVALAAVSGDTVQIMNESADLMYHLLVLLKSVDLSMQDVCKELASRNRMITIY